MGAFLANMENCEYNKENIISSKIMAATISSHLTNNTSGIVIVDEVSMVDVNIFYHLLKAVKKGSQVILVGDKDQLPSVGAGNVLADILNSNTVDVTMLTEIYRQDAKSLIIANAHAINEGEMPVIDNSSRDFFFENKFT